MGATTSFTTRPALRTSHADVGAVDDAPNRAKPGASETEEANTARIEGTNDGEMAIGFDAADDGHPRTFLDAGATTGDVAPHRWSSSLSAAVTATDPVRHWRWLGPALAEHGFPSETPTDAFFQTRNEYVQN